MGKTSVLRKTLEMGPSSSVLPMPMTVNCVPLAGTVGSELMGTISLDTFYDSNTGNRGQQEADLQRRLS